MCVDQTREQNGVAERFGFDIGRPRNGRIGSERCNLPIGSDQQRRMLDGGPSIGKSQRAASRRAGTATAEYSVSGRPRP